MRRAAIDHARQKVTGARRIVRIADRSRADPEMNRDRRRFARLFRDDDDAVVERRARGSETRAPGGNGLGHQEIAIGSGSNQPTVRFEGANMVCAATATSSSRAASMRAVRSANRSALAMVSKYPIWWAMLVTLSLS